MEKGQLNVGDALELKLAIYILNVFCPSKDIISEIKRQYQIKSKINDKQVAIDIDGNVLEIYVTKPVRTNIMAILDSIDKNAYSEQLGSFFSNLKKESLKRIVMNGPKSGQEDIIVYADDKIINIQSKYASGKNQLKQWTINKTCNCSKVDVINEYLYGENKKIIPEHHFCLVKKEEELKKEVRELFSLMNNANPKSLSQWLLLLQSNNYRIDNDIIFIFVSKKGIMEMSNNIRIHPNISDIEANDPNLIEYEVISSVKVAPKIIIKFKGIPLMQIRFKNETETKRIYFERRTFNNVFVEDMKC